MWRWLMRVIRVNVEYTNGKRRPVLLPTNPELWETATFTCSIDGSEPSMISIPQEYGDLHELRYFLGTKTKGEVLYE